MRLQGDVENRNHRLHATDFGGWFSGSAVGPAISGGLRRMANFPGAQAGSILCGGSIWQSREPLSIAANPLTQYYAKV